MALIKFKPESSFSNVIENFFGRDLADWPTNSLINGYNTIPAVNVAENEKSYRLDIAVPGMNKDDFELNVSNNLLTISAKHEDNKEEKDEKFTRREFYYTSFERSFTLPPTVESEHIEANYKDGVLHVHLPKQNNHNQADKRLIKVS